jgi:hypothetical protein
MADDREEARGFGRVLTGTAPGLEWFLFASVPAIVAGSIGYFVLGPWPGVGVGVAILALGVVALRRRGRRPSPQSDQGDVLK